MNILITGCAGFIGSNLCERLIKSNIEIIGIDNFDPFYDVKLKQQNVQALLENRNFKLYSGDIRDNDFLEGLFNKHTFNIVVHIAAKAGVRPSIENPREYYDVNVNGTLNLLENMRKHNVKKILFASSSSVYGNNKKMPFSEDYNNDNPMSPYAATKKSCELMLWTYYQLFGIKSISLRFFTVYGPRQRPEMAIAHFTKKIFMGENINLFANGESSRDYTYVDDIVNGIEYSLNKIDDYNIINLGNSSPVKLRYLVSVIENSLNKKAKITLYPNQPGDVDVTYADISKAKKILGYNPNIKIEEGIKKYTEWYIANKFINE
ncbi:MAG: GDP-mannose 4,6-dehydratase [Ignavibacteriaceae bacterium]